MIVQICFEIFTFLSPFSPNLTLNPGPTRKNLDRQISQGVNVFKVYLSVVLVFFFAYDCPPVSILIILGAHGILYNISIVTGLVLCKSALKNALKILHCLKSSLLC